MAYYNGKKIIATVYLHQTDNSDATAKAADIKAGKTEYVEGVKVTETNDKADKEATK